MSSAIPNAVSQLVTIATNALPSTAVVHLGKPEPRYIAPVELKITAVRGQQTPAELGPNYKREERFSIECVLITWAGDDNYTQRMTDCFTNYALLTTAIANNPNLNSTVRFAEPTQMDIVFDSDNAGRTLCGITFNVECQVRITSLT